jgi:hypothetical protein
MQTNPPRGPAKGTTAEELERFAKQRAAQIRLLLIGVIVLAVGGLGYAILRAKSEEASLERWDVASELRRELEPQQDPFWVNPQGVYNPERERLLKALEKFLDEEAQQEDDALAPHVRFLIAKTVADHLLSNPHMLDRAKRDALYAKGAAQLEAIRDKHPDFPLNWSTLAEDGFPSLTRQFLHWYRENEKWEQEHLLTARAPDGDVRVLLRTERGDLLMGLYGGENGAVAWTDAFLERVGKGHYDGTAFMAKQAVGDVAEPEQHFVAAGGEASRAVKNFDTASALEASEAPARSGRLPAETRNRIPHDAGVVSAWHPPGVEYDNDERFLVVVRRSPMLDYEYTPVGKLVVEHGVESFKTLDRIFGGAEWRDDRDVRGDAEMKEILGYFQAPVRIVKALVYRNGKLARPVSGAAPERADVEPSEQSLATLQADRYKQEPSVRPSKKKPGEDDKGEDGGQDDGPPGDVGPGDDEEGEGGGEDEDK